MVFVEFLEFIGRIAEMMFSNNRQMSLTDKIKYVLQRIFASIHTSIKEPQIDADLVSESDEEEYGD